MGEKLRKITCVTLPRSGHHFLINCLLKYFSGDLSYPETDGRTPASSCCKVLEAGELFYCEFYSHCNKMPCSDERTNFQKTHNKKIQNKQSNFYIIQYRHPLEYLVAHYEYVSKKRNISISENNWLNFLYRLKPFAPEDKEVNMMKKAKIHSDASKIISWKDFVVKWVINNNNPNTYYLVFDHLINNTFNALVEVIRFIAPEHRIKKDFIKKVLQSNSPARKRDLSIFEFINTNVSKKMEKSACREMDLLNFKNYFTKNNHEK